LKDLEDYLNSKIGISINKNLELLRTAFTKIQLDELSNKTIAVVGTNGKTSTVNFIYRLLRSNQKSCLMFTSPHLVHYTERLKSDTDLDLQRFLSFLNNFEDKNNIVLGYFEALFLLACKSYLESDSEYFICEAGIGGKLDTTSIIQSKNVVLTSIGKDHQDLLGYTDQEVLDQKILISSNIENLFTGDINDELISFIENNYSHIKNNYLLRDIVNTLNYDLLNLMANQKNYLVALYVVSTLLNTDIVNERKKINFETIEGRFEIINENPTRILDGAHNLDGVKHLLNDYEKQYSFNKTDIFIGVKKGKDLEKIISLIENRKKYNIYFIEENTFYDQENPAKYFDYCHKTNIGYEVVNLDAFSSNKNPSILLGSLYLIGEYKKRKLV
jgi:dihydrofolate synthase/folylpolyglutamate synthase